MARPLIPATATDVESTLRALDYLKLARTALRDAGAPAALAKVESSIKSTEGAVRHVQRRYRAGLGQTGPDFTGPNLTGPNLTGPNLTGPAAA